MNPRRGEQRGGCGATLSWLSENTVEVILSATNFLTRSLKDLQNKIDISNEAHELASLITDCKGDIRTVKIVLITDGITQKRPADIYDMDGIEIVRTIWEIESLDFCAAGKYPG